MTDDAEPGRPSAHDLAAFDLTKCSPEQLAQSFAQWKARRRPAQAATGAGTPIGPKPAQVATKQAEKPAAPDGRTLAAKRGWAKRSIRVQYSDTFSSLLAAGSEPAMQRIPPAPIIVAPPTQRRMVSPGRRLRTMTILAGAASLFALAGGALLELSSWRADDAEPNSPQIQQAPMATIAPIARAAADAPTVAWTLQPVIDRALLRAAAPVAPAMPSTRKAVAQSATSAAPQPIFRKAAPETAQFVAKPFIPNVASAAQPEPAMPARVAVQLAPMKTAIHTGDPRPDALFQHNRGQGDAAFSGRLASSGSKPEAAPKSKSAVQAPAAARNSKAANIGSGDPRGESGGGAQAASDAGTGTDAGAADGADASAGAGGSASSGGNDAGGGDGGGTDVGGEGTDSGGADAGEPAGSDGEPAGDPTGGENNAGNADADPGN